MREIKFRFYDPFYKQMIYSSEIELSPLSEFFREFEEREDNDCKLMQFAGLHDKAGKEIYEGDKLKDGDLNESVGTVEFLNDCFILRISDEEYYLLRHYEGRATITGNIYEQ